MCVLCMLYTLAGQAFEEVSALYVRLLCTFYTYALYVCVWALLYGDERVCPRQLDEIEKGSALCIRLVRVYSHPYRIYTSYHLIRVYTPHTFSPCTCVYASYVWQEEKKKVGSYHDKLSIYDQVEERTMFNGQYAIHTYKHTI